MPLAVYAPQEKENSFLALAGPHPQPFSQREKGEDAIGNLGFKRRGISLEIKELVRPAPHHAAKPKRLSEHLLKTTHNCVPGFIRNPHWQPGLFPHISVQPAELDSVTRKNDPTIIYISGYFSRKLSERCRDDFNYLANHVVSDGINFPGCDLQGPGAAIQNIATLDRDFLREVFRQSC